MLTPRLTRLFRQGSTAAVVGTLIVLSCSLTVVEIAVGSASRSQTALTSLDTAISAVFAVELALRFIAAPHKPRWAREYWTDVLSLAPAVFGVHVVPGVRLLRLLRLVRLVAIMRRYPILTARIARRGPRQLVVMSGLVLLVVYAATAAMLAFEGGTNPTFDSFKDAFWFSVYSFFANEPIPGPPHSVGGRVVSVVLMVTGLGTFAVLTGTISALMVERLRSEVITMDWDEISDHLIICGWNRKAEIIVQEYLSAGREPPVVVISRLDGEAQFADPALRRAVQFLNDDFTKVSALEKAGIKRASTCVILSDTSKGRGERDADARTILAALTVEKLNPQVYTCAEINRREYASHLELGNVNSFVVGGEHSAFLLAQASLHRAFFAVFSDLLTFRSGSRFCRVRVPDAWATKTFVEAMVELKKTHNAILVAVEGSDGKVVVNPSDFKFAGGESAVVIAASDIDL